jgi:hypothetical protein
MQALFPTHMESIRQHYNATLQSCASGSQVRTRATPNHLRCSTPIVTLHILDKITRSVLLIITQENKRDIIYRRLNSPPSAYQVTALQSLVAYLNSIAKTSFLSTIPHAVEALQSLQHINLACYGLIFRIHVFFPRLRILTLKSYPLTTLIRQ